MHTFSAFKKWVDKYLVDNIGLSSDCIADCRWRDLFEDSNFEKTGTVSDEDIRETACEFNPELEDIL